MRIRIVLAVMLAYSTLAKANPVLHHFELWGTMTERDKLPFYIGWLNGFLTARGAVGVQLVGCLSKMSYPQAIAMINKYYDGHPEKWSSSATEQILDALTVPGSVCEGKRPILGSGSK